MSEIKKKRKSGSHRNSKRLRRASPSSPEHAATLPSVSSKEVSDILLSVEIKLSAFDTRLLRIQILHKEIQAPSDSLTLQISVRTLTAATIENCTTKETFWDVQTSLSGII